MIEHMKDIYQIDNDEITNGTHAHPTDNELRTKILFIELGRFLCHFFRPIKFALFVN